VEQSFLYLADLAREVVPPPDGTLSRTLFQDAKLKAVLFGFAAGQELSEHTASTPAVMHFLAGEASVTLGDERREVGPGAWVHMAPGLRHAIRAKTTVVMLLLLLR
jgi:quercetin dioxygenase-like cupin family protein